MVDCRKTNGTTDDAKKEACNDQEHDEPKARKVFVTPEEIAANSITDHEYLASTGGGRVQDMVPVSEIPDTEESEKDKGQEG